MSRVAARGPDPYLDFLRDERKRFTQFVDMNDAGEISVPIGDSAQIATAGLCGCIAVATVSQAEDGIRNAYLQHYSPNRSDIGEERLTKYLMSVKDKGKLVSARTLIMVPGQSDGGIHYVGDVRAVNLERIALDMDSPANSVRIYPYLTWHTFKEYGAGSLIAEITAIGEPVIKAGLVSV